MLQYANLHFHSTHSDGVYTPTELAVKAKEEGYSAIALADHDTVTGIDECREVAASLGLGYIEAAEFTTDPNDRGEYGIDFHMVGMSFDRTYEPMRAYLARLGESETHQTERCFRQGVERGFLSGITWDEVLDFNRGIAWICNEHVFRAMKAKGLATDLDYPAFFQNVFGVHRYEAPPLHPFLGPNALIGLIREAGGIPVLAHPHKQMIHADRMRENGLLGVEVWHHNLTLDEQLATLRYAIEHDMFVSGGSDHSGLLGGQYDRYPVPQECPHWAESCTLGTQKLFFEELCERTLATRAERLNVLAAFEEEVLGGKRI